MIDITMTRILCMEDDPGLALLVQRNLQRKGYVIDVAVDGEEGLKMVENNHYELLLVDYNMPFCGGIDVIHALSQKGLSIPVIMVTGQGNEEVAVEALKMGAADYLVKDMELKYLELLPVVIDRAIHQQQLVKERKQMIEAVRESEERYRRVVELSPEGIAIHVEGKFVFINPAGMKFLGIMKQEQIIGKPFSAFVHPDFRELADERTRLMEKEGDAPWIEGKFVRLDGTEFDVETAGVAFSYGGKAAIQIIFRDTTEEKAVKERLKQLALYDTLTGLPNRSLFFDRMGQLLVLAKRNQYVLALLYMDLDHFKHINDTLGHEVGDLLLAEAGKRMKGCTRGADTVARMGGDEFIGICGRITAAGDAAVVAQKIVAALSEPFLLKGQVCSVGASIGISVYPNDGDDVETLLHKADTAMYHVKALERGGYRFYSELAQT